MAPSSRTHTQSIAHIDADELGADDLTSNFIAPADRDTRPALSSHVHSNVSAPPIRHFTRFKMGHLRPAPPASNYALQHPSAAGLPSQSLGPGGASNGGLGPGAGRRSEQKAGVIRNLEGGMAGAATNGAQDGEAGTAAPTLDERANDAMWTVPKSRIFEEAYAEFSLPLLQPSGATEPTPSMSQIRHIKWRAARHAAIENHARELLATHPAKSSYVEVAYLNAEWEATGCVLFHPYESMLLAADTHAAIGVWNYSEEERGHERINTFKNDNPPGSKINGMKFINEKSVSLLLVASDEGVVRIWRNVHEEGAQTLVTAWVANPQPEVFYGPTASPNTLTTVVNAAAHQPLDNNVITPSHSYQDPVTGGTGSSLTPQARLVSRGSVSGVGFHPLATGAGVGSVLAVGMRHSASTPALALSGGSSHNHPGHSSNSRSGSFISPTGSLLQGGTGGGGPGSAQAGQSPTLRPSHSPSMGPSSGAMNIPSYSLSGGSANAPQQKHSPQTNGAAGMNGQGATSGSSGASSRRKHRPPLIVEWQPSHGRLLASGNGLEHLRLWDVHQEQCISEIPILGHESLEPHLPTWVTSMDTNDGDLAWVGCIDGHLRCFDIRLPPVESLVSTARLHRSPVHSVRLQRHGQDGGMLISASVGGDIALADVRMGMFDTTRCVVFPRCSPYAHACLF